MLHECRLLHALNEGLERQLVTRRPRCLTSRFAYAGPTTMEVVLTELSVGLIALRDMVGDNQHGVARRPLAFVLV